MKSHYSSVLVNCSLWKYYKCSLLSQLAGGAVLSQSKHNWNLLSLADSMFLVVLKTKDHSSI